MSKRGAGDDSSGDDFDLGAVTAKRRAVNAENLFDFDDEDDDTPQRPTGSASKPQDDSEDEEDSDPLSELSEFNDGYGPDLMGDDADRRRLDLMTEVEREQELYDREQRRQALKEKWEIRQMAKRERNKRRQQQKAAKRKAKPAAAKPKPKPATTRRTTRRDDDDFIDDEPEEEDDFVESDDDDDDYGKPKSKAKAKKPAAKKKSTRSTRRAAADDSDESDWEPGAKKKSKAKAKKYESDEDDDYSEVSDYADEEEAHIDRMRRKKDAMKGPRGMAKDRRDSEAAAEAEARGKEEAKVQDINRIFLSRDTLRKWLFAPFLANVIPGTVVRLFWNLDQHTGMRSYRMAEVVRAEKDENATYRIDDEMTNVFLYLRMGKEITRYKGDVLSNGEIMPHEYEDFRMLVHEQKGKRILVRDVEKVGAKLAEAHSYAFSNEEINEMVRERKELNSDTAGDAKRRVRVLEDLKRATERGDFDEEERLKMELDRIDQKLKGDDRYAKVKALNATVRRYNKVEIEKLMVPEPDDPFVRKRCMPTMVTSGTDVSGDKKPDASPSLKAGKSPSLTPSRQAQATKKEAVDDLFAAHDFDLDLDVKTVPGAENLDLGPASTNNGTHLDAKLKKLGVSEATNGAAGAGKKKKMLSLSAYKKDKGLL
eukprot:Clim_evm17s214 gene=Clim_evmTU17s214